MADNPIVPISERALVQADGRIALGNKALAVVDAARLARILARHEEAWEYLLSSHPNALELVNEHSASSDWKRISTNVKMPWSAELIANYEDRWDWGQLSSNEGLPWSVELIERYEERWDCLAAEQGNTAAQHNLANKIGRAHV